MEVWNLETIPDYCEALSPDGGITRYLGRAAGSEKLYVNMDTIPPGAFSAKYHAHTRQEEFFLVLSGTGTLRTPAGERLVAAGDFIAKPCGEEYAHTFYNSGAEPLVILDAGTVERGDVCIYPDEDTYYLRDQGITFRGGDRLEVWSSEPTRA